MKMKHELDHAHIMKSANQDQTIVAHDSDATVEEEPTLIVEENSLALEPNTSILPASGSGAVEEELPVEHTLHLTLPLLEFEPAESLMPASPSAAVKDELSVKQAPYFAQQLEALEAEQRARQNERAEKEALKKKSREIEEEMNRIAKALEREKRETERLRLHYESRLHEMEQRVAAAKAARHAAPASEEAEEENISSSKATFRIDLYSHERQFQGKIEHMLTHDKCAFSGIDHAAMNAFIAAHLPQVETKVEELQKIDALQAHEESKLEAPTVTPSAPAATPALAAEPRPNPLRLRGMDILLSGSHSRVSMLAFDQAFDLQFELEHAERIPPELASWSCQVAFFAKRLESGPQQNLGEITHQLSASEHTPPFRLLGAHLPRGTYRLVAVASIRCSEAAQTKPYSLTAQKYIQIY
ncbi:MAG: hypothetical protein AAB354_07560 [candidate division KSB1 bacterium]